MRAAWATLTSTPWRRAPLLLRRRPGVLAAVTGATAVVMAAIAAVPLFLSSAGTGAIALQADERCGADTGVSTVVRPTPASVRDPAPDPYRPLAELTRYNEWAVMPTVALGSEPAAVLYRDDAKRHVDLLAGGRGPGIWITDRAAEAGHLGVGDATTIAGHPTTVAAIYRDRAGYTTDAFWCANNPYLLVQSRGGDLVLPAPVVLVDRATFADVLEASPFGSAWQVGQAELADGLTVGDARRLLDDLACHGRDPGALSWCAGGQPEVPTRRGDAFPARDDRDFVELWFNSSLPFVLARAAAIRVAVGSGIWPVAAFAALAGAGLVAAAASLWFERRRRDVVLLSVRGVSPAGLGGKAVLELVVPLVVGGALGLAVADAVVTWLGPSPHIEGSAVARAALAGLAGVVASAATIALVVAARTRGARLGRHRRWGRVPWEVALVVAAGASYRRLGRWGIPVGQGADVSTVDVGALLFPILFLLAAVAGVSHLLGLGLGPLRRASRGWPMPLFLAVRRVARARAATLGLLAATALAAGVLVYAVTMGGSLRATLDAKAKTFVGSDIEADVEVGQPLPASLDGRATVVELHRDAWIGPDRERANVLAIDPATFADAAYWDDTFASRSLRSIVADLRRPGTAVVVGYDADGPTTLEVGQAVPDELTVTDVGHVRAFPGMRKQRPTVFLAKASLDPGIIGAEAEVWIRGDRDASVRLLQRAGVPFEETRTVRDVVDRSAFVTVAWTFGFLRSLGVAAGLLAVGGVAVHLDARRRERLLGYAFLGRMGLRPRQHRRALAAELVASVVVGAGVGIAAALAGAAVAHGRIDPMPAYAPDPLLRLSTTAALAAGLGAVAVVVVATVVAQRRSERDDPVEVLRAGA